jgi:hypothetical protein
MKIKETEVTREIRAVRDRMARRVEQEGMLAFYASLAGHAEKLMARHRSPERLALPRSLKARKAKRRALVDALPEPRAIQEIRLIRQGKEMDRRHALKYVESPSSADVLNDKPSQSSRN